MSCHKYSKVNKVLDVTGCLQSDLGELSSSDNGYDFTDVDVKNENCTNSSH